jgi:glycerophosphoryl diester phosphodiesterase
MDMPPLIIAHRGDSAHRPENTLVSFSSALAVGAELVEFDVQLTRDRQVVVLHDATLDRTTTGTGPVGASSLQEVKALSAGYPALFGPGYPDERVPTLTEALELLKGRAKVMLEIKTESVTADAETGIEALTLAEVRRLGMEKEVALISFDRRALARCRQRAPEIPRGHLFFRAEPGEMLLGCHEVAAEICMPEKSLLSDQLRERVREAGIKLATWVVDDPDELRILDRFDLFGVGSNRPAAMLAALKNA